jgi:hypothetical protein
MLTSNWPCYCDAIEVRSRIDWMPLRGRPFGSCPAFGLFDVVFTLDPGQGRSFCMSPLNFLYPHKLGMPNLMGDC